MRKSVLPSPLGARVRLLPMLMNFHACKPADYMRKGSVKASNGEHGTSDEQCMGGVGPDKVRAVLEHLHGATGGEVERNGGVEVGGRRTCMVGHVRGRLLRRGVGGGEARTIVVRVATRGTSSRAGYLSHASVHLQPEAEVRVDNTEREKAASNGRI